MVRDNSPRRQDRDDNKRRRTNDNNNNNQIRNKNTRYSYEHNRSSISNRNQSDYSNGSNVHPRNQHDREIIESLQHLKPISSELKSIIENQAYKIDKEVSHSNKDTRELFVGNVIDNDASENTLKLFMNTAMRKLGIVNPNDEPVVSCRMSNKYCFVEFQTSFDCSIALNLNGIPFKEYSLKLGRPIKYSGPNYPTLTWQDLVGNQTMNIRSTNINKDPNTLSLIPHPNTKSYREIFVGNTEFDMSEQLMRDYIGTAMQKMGISHSGLENPIINVKLAGKFAFLEMRTSIDAANVLNLNGIPFLGSTLNLVRPTKYDGGMGGMDYYKWDSLYKSWLKGDLRLLTSGTPTRVIMISNMATNNDLHDSNRYLDIIEELRLECSQFGIVRSVIVPRTNVTTTMSTMSNTNQMQIHYQSICKAFIEMNSIEQAVQVVLGLKGRSFDNRILDIKFYSEDAFHNMNYTLPMVESILTLSHGFVTKEQVFTHNALSKIEKEMI